MRTFLIATMTLMALNFAGDSLRAALVPPSSGLQGWFRADTGVTTISGDVSQWNDQSGNSNHATQIATANGRPNLSSALMPIGTNQPVITYGDNTDGNYDQLNLPNISQDGGTGATVYFVVNDDADGTTTVRNWLNRDTTGGPPYAPAIYGNPSASNDAGFYFDTSFHAGAPVGVTGWKVARFAWDGSTASTFISDYTSSQSGSTSDLPDVTTTWTSIATGVGVPSQHTLFSVAELLIYDRTLTPTEDAQVLQYLQYNFFEAAPVPEPSSMMLLGLGVLVLVRHSRRRRARV